MEKATFVLLVNTLVSVNEERNKFSDELLDVFKRHRELCEPVSLRDIVYDTKLEDVIIDIFEIEMGVYARDRVADYVYEQHNNFGMCVCSPYPILDSAEELYDDIVKNGVCGK